LRPTPNDRSRTGPPDDSPQNPFSDTAQQPQFPRPQSIKDPFETGNRQRCPQIGGNSGAAGNGRSETKLGNRPPFRCARKENLSSIPASRRQQLHRSLAPDVPSGQAAPRQNANKFAFELGLHNFAQDEPARRQAAPRQNANEFVFALGLHYLCPKVKNAEMKTDEGFSVEVESRYEAWWRYNVTILCGCFDAAGERVGFASAERIVAPVGSDQPLPPQDAAAAKRGIGLATAPCERIVLYVYIVPHTLPETREIGAVSPFEVRVRIGYAGNPLSEARYKINPWSGASLEIKLGRDGKPFVQ